MLSQGLGGSPAIFASHRAAVGNAQISKNRLSQKVLKYIKTPETVMVSGAICGASDLTRTGDLLITSEMHYRLCYTSITSSFIIAALWEKVKTSIKYSAPGFFCGGAAGHQRSRGAWWGRGGGRRGGTWRSRGRRPGLSRCRDHG